MRIRRGLAVPIVAALLLGAGLWLSRIPSNDRPWQPNEAQLPAAEFSGDLVRIHNVRNTVYRSTDDYTPAYEERTYDLRRLERVWFVVNPFSNWGGAAHTFLTFEFTGPAFLAISIEARKERGETYHFVKGLLRSYELMYVVADERDVIRLRTTVRRDDVYLYPIRATPERVRQLFTAMLVRANALRDRPEFYNTLTSNCTNNISRHINALVPGRIPFSLKVVFPGYADRLAYDLGLIDTALPYDSIRAHFRITGAAQRWSDAPDFSTRIREGLVAP